MEPEIQVIKKVRKRKWVVYIIQTGAGKLYTGITTDLNRRFSEHQNKKKGARFFHFSNPETIVFQERHINRSKATKREMEIKKMSRTKKLELVNLSVFTVVKET